MNTSIIEHLRMGWKFWIGWVVATILSLVIGGAIGMFVGVAVGFGMVGLHLLPFMQGSITDVGVFAWVGSMAMTIGGALGLSQWLVLRSQVAQSSRWVLACVAGWAMAEIVAQAVLGSSQLHTVMGDPITPEQLLGFCISVGVTQGILQWLVLRQQIPHMKWWVLVSLLSWAAGAGAIRLFVGSEFEIGELSSLQGVLVGGLTVGAITGGALMWLLLFSTTQSPNQKTKRGDLIIAR